MTLAFVLFHYFPYGGQQRDMLAMAQEATARGHAVSVICTTWAAAEPTAFAVTRLPPRGCTNAARMRNFATDVAATVAAREFDLVIGFNKLPGLDLYFAADTCFAWKAWRQKGWLYRLTARAQTYLAFERAVFGADQPTEILDISLRERQRFQEFYQTPAARFHLLPPGIDRDRVAPSHYAELRAATRKKLNAGDDHCLLLALGSDFKRKGVDRTIAALGALRVAGKLDARLLVAGTGKPSRLLRQAQALGVADRVAFLGARDDVPALLQAADILVHPAYEESAGNVLIEAMLAGLPVVATDVCGYAHYVAAAAMGRVIPSPFRTAALVQAITEVVAVAREHWRARGRSLASDNTLYARPQVAVDIIEALVARRRHSRVPG